MINKSVKDININKLTIMILLRINQLLYVISTYKYCNYLPM